MKHCSLVLPRKKLNELYTCVTFGCNSCSTVHDEYIVKLEKDLSLIESSLSKKKTRYMLHSNSMCDCKLPLEKKIDITKKIIDITYKYAYGLTLLTKNIEILDEMERLVEINKEKRVVIMTTICSSEEYLNKKIDQNNASIKDKFEMLSKFNKRGIDTIVWITPILPYINDSTSNIKGILDLCKKTGVKGIMTSNLSVNLLDETKEYFYDQLDKFPNLKEKYIEQFDYSNNINTAKI